MPAVQFVGEIINVASIYTLKNKTNIRNLEVTTNKHTFKNLDFLSAFRRDVTF